MILTSDIILNTRHLDPVLVASLKKKLTYRNPKFQDARRLGLWTGKIPETIATFEEQDTHILRIMRGEFYKVHEAFPLEPVETRMDKGPQIAVRYQNDDFELDPHQRRAVDALCMKKQGIIHAATSAGKSAIIMAAIGELKRPTIVLIHRKILLDQLVKDANKWLKGDFKIGIIGNGKCDIQDITFAIDKSLSKAVEKDPALTKRWDVLIQDEVHLSAAPTLQNLVGSIDAIRKFGLTGTLKRKDRMDFLMFAAFGRVMETITKEDLLSLDRATPVEIRTVETEATVPSEMFDLGTTERWRKIEEHIHGDDTRMDFLAGYVAALLKDETKRIVVLSRYVDPCYVLGQKIYEASGIAPRHITGKEKDNVETCHAMKHGDCRLICATIGCFSTGVDVPNLTDIILISPIFSNELLLKQILGRLARKSVGKKDATFHFVFDPFIFERRRLNSALRILNS